MKNLKLKFLLIIFLLLITLTQQNFVSTRLCPFDSIRQLQKCYTKIINCQIQIQNYCLKCQSGIFAIFNGCSNNQVIRSLLFEKQQILAPEIYNIDRRFLASRNTILNFFPDFENAFISKVILQRSSGQFFRIWFNLRNSIDSYQTKISIPLPFLNLFPAIVYFRRNLLDFNPNYITTNFRQLNFTPTQYNDDIRFWAARNQIIRVFPQFVNAIISRIREQVLYFGTVFRVQYAIRNFNDFYQLRIQVPSLLLNTLPRIIEYKKNGVGIIVNNFYSTLSVVEQSLSPFRYLNDQMFLIARNQINQIFIRFNPSLITNVIQQVVSFGRNYRVFFTLFNGLKDKYEVKVFVPFSRLNQQARIIYILKNSRNFEIGFNNNNNIIEQIFSPSVYNNDLRFIQTKKVILQVFPDFRKAIINRVTVQNTGNIIYRIFFNLLNFNDQYQIKISNSLDVRLAIPKIIYCLKNGKEFNLLNVALPNIFGNLIQPAVPIISTRPTRPIRLFRPTLPTLFGLKKFYCLLNTILINDFQLLKDQSYQFSQIIQKSLQQKQLDKLFLVPFIELGSISTMTSMKQLFKYRQI